MYKELLTEILPYFAADDLNEETEVNIDGDTLRLSVNKEDNKIILTVEYVQEDKFEKWVKSLDQDVFIEACERFQEFTGNKLTDEVDHNVFKEVVNTIIKEKICTLQKQLG